MDTKQTILDYIISNGPIGPTQLFYRSFDAISSTIVRTIMWELLEEGEIEWDYMFRMKVAE